MSVATETTAAEAPGEAPANRAEARPVWRIDWIAVPRFHLAILSALSLLLAVFCTANIQLIPESSDSQTNFAVGITFADTGYFAPEPGLGGWHMREPFVPLVVAGYHFARGALGLPTIAPECVPSPAQQDVACMRATAPYRHVNVAFIVLGAVSSFLLVYGTIGAAFPAYVAFLASGTSTMLLNALNRFVTEAHAGALMTLAAVLLCMLLSRRRVWQAVALGACLAALTLTKIVFTYLWLVVAAILVVLALLERRTALRLVWLAAIVAVTHGAIATAWMTRNYVTAGQFKLMDGRSFRVLSVRASYNEMTMEEWLTGFVYFLPLYTERQVEAMGFPRSSFERFNSANENSFRRVGQQRYRAAVREEVGKAVEAGVADPNRHVYALLAARYRDQMLSDPVAHLRVTVLLAYLGTFPELGFGVNFPSKIGRIGDEWSLPVPQLGYRLDRAGMTVFNAATTLAILSLPFVLFLRNRNIGGLVIALPVLYSHGAYAVASHFIIRYARPEIPLRNVALCILAWLLVAAAVRFGRARLPGTGGRRTPEPEEAR